MATMRTYGDGCAIARALDVVGERWALLVVRELLLGPKRYTDLRRGLPNASPNVLSERLRELERAGVVRRRKLPPPAGSRVYELTDWGRELEEIVISLGHWAARSPTAAERRSDRSADSIILALRSRFDSGAAHGTTRQSTSCGSARIAFGSRWQTMRSRSPAGAPIKPTRRSTPTPTRSAPCSGAGRSLADAQRSGRLTIEGDKAAVERFVRLFPLPSRRLRQAADFARRRLAASTASSRPGKRVVQVVRAQRQQPLAALGPGADHAGLAQHLEVVRERRLREAELEHSAGGLVAVGEPPHDLQPGRVAQGVEDGGELELSAGWVVGLPHALAYCDRV